MQCQDLYKYMLKNGPMSNSEIMEELGENRGFVTNVMSNLKHMGKVYRIGRNKPAVYSAVVLNTEKPKCFVLPLVKRGK